MRLQIIVVPLLGCSTLLFGHVATPGASTQATPNMELGNDLVAATIAGDESEVYELIQNHADLEARDDHQRTPLMIATNDNNIEIARQLIEAGADVNAKDEIQDSPYLYSGARGLNEILLLTLEHGADLKSTNRFGGTALIPACERGHVETVRILIEAGIDVDHVNNLGWTGLLEAIILSDGGEPHQQIVQLLIDTGADVNLADFDGVTPLQHAQDRGYTIIANKLLAAGAK